jgi:hypothetical protein
MIGENMKMIRTLLVLSLLAVFYLMLLGGDCGTDNDPAPPGVGAPENVKLKVDQDSLGGSFAEISWDASSSHNLGEFKGYRVITYRVNESGDILALFEDRETGKTDSHIVLNIDRDTTRYRSFVIAEMNDGRSSDSVGTQVYSGVYHGRDGGIDEYIEGSLLESGFGFDITNGTGTKYIFNQDNVSLIDLHLRGGEDTLLYFYSPDQFELINAKTTLIGIVGTGQTAFDNTELVEPAMSSAEVRLDNVYLLKTEDEYYIKIWVRSVVNIIDPYPYKHVIFEYKVQPARGLMLVKR